MKKLYRDVEPNEWDDSKFNRTGGQPKMTREEKLLPFKVDTIENVGENWLIANFGEGADGEKYILTTNNIRASELHNYSDDAKSDAELICKLLNEHYTRPEPSPEAERAYKVLKKGMREPDNHYMRPFLDLLARHAGIKTDGRKVE